MGELIDRLKTAFGGEEDKTDIGCRVVVSDDEGGVEVCGNDVYGTGCVDGHKIEYCLEADAHVPSNATPWNSGLIGTLDFYIPEEDEIIEVE